MGSGKRGWKLSFHHRSPSSTAPSSPASAKGASVEEAPPREFMCAISGALMADPVILPSGLTFERACIQACADLGFTSPPSFPSPLDHSLLLIPNVALRSAILNWCERAGHPRPVPVSPDDARDLVRRLMPKSKQDSDEDPSRPISHGREMSKESSKESASSPNTPPLAMLIKTASCYSPPSSSPSSYYSSSSYSSTEIVPVALEETQTMKSRKVVEFSSSPAPVSLEDEILVKLKDPRVSEQEAALCSLRCATRESRDSRVALCTPRLLSALRPLLFSRYAGVQSNAVASLVNLSLEAANKVPIVRSGAVPALVDALKCGHPEARDHAAGALFSLAMDEENRDAIGVLGAVPPLLHLFSRPADSPRARRDAGMALYHLSLAGTNRSKLARAPGAVRSLLNVVAECSGAGAGLGRAALMVLCNVTGSAEGRAAMMDAGAVAGVAALMKSKEMGAEERQHCVAALYGMSRGSLRFRGLARAARVEEALARVVDDESTGEAAREMAKRVLMAMSGEMDYGDDTVAAAAEGSVVSDGAVSFLRRHSEFTSDSDVNSAEF